MNICGIICEYNPFHSGHDYQIKETRKKADAVVAVMSGSFTQRGEPALFDKWSRASAAVRCGVNLVIELPFFISCSPAEYFASGAVRLLKATGIVNSLSFGSESGSLDELCAMADSEEKSENIKENLRSGNSYAKAVGNDFLTPNNILAIEYIRSVRKYAPSFELFTIKRQGEGYLSSATGESIISATGCRQLIAEKKLDELSKYVPGPAFEIYKEKITAGDFSVISNLDSLFIGLLRRDRSFLKDIAYVSEGIENCFYRYGDICSGITEVAELVKSKRYTRARINRIIANSLVGVTKDDLTEFLSATPAYAHVLAADNLGLSLLKDIKIPVITNGKAANSLSGTAKKIWDAECLATDIHALSFANKENRRGRQDYTHFFNT